MIVLACTFTVHSGDSLVEAEPLRQPEECEEKEEGEAFINGSETGAAVLDECM